MRNMGREIGRIVEVKGVSVKAELFELLPPYLLNNGEVVTAPRINTYVKTRVGLDTVICQITGEYNDEKTMGSFSGYFLDLTVKGYIDRGCFIQGLRLLPIVAASVELLDEKDFEKIYDCDVGNSFSVGRSLFESNREVFLNYNDIIPSHMGIFGNTGSGKSNTLTKILSSYSNVLRYNHNGRMLIFDINNEYGGDAICDKNCKRIYHLSTRNSNGDLIPFKLDDLQEDDWCILLNATEATQRPVVKSAFKDNRNDIEYAEAIKNIIKTNQIALFNTIRYQVGTYIKGIECIKWHSKSNRFYYEKDEKVIYDSLDEFKNVLNEITVKSPTSGIDRVLFKLYMAAAFHVGYGTQYDFISPMLRRAEKLKKDFDKVFDYSDEDMFENENIVVIQLADVNRDMKQMIPAIIANRYFEEQVIKKDGTSINSILNIIIDEAHNLLYEDNGDFRHVSVVLETFERIVKEGRKFGVFLWIASQRPSDISGTIISQMHNYFIHKLVNPYDLSRIRKTVAFLDEESLNTITVLGPGECILSGSMVSVPTFIKIDRVEEENRPNSENVVLFGQKGIFRKRKTRHINNM